MHALALNGSLKHGVYLPFVEVSNPEKFNAKCQANEVGRPDRIKLVFIQLGYVCGHSCEESNCKNFEVEILI